MSGILHAFRGRILSLGAISLLETNSAKDVRGIDGWSRRVLADGSDVVCMYEQCSRTSWHCGMAEGLPPAWLRCRFWLLL